MTWGNLIATGSGRAEFRLVIEGWPTQYVTLPAMEQTLGDGRERVAGLMRDGLSLEESASPAYGELDSSGMTVSIVDRQRDDAVTESLANRPTAVTYLTLDLTTSATSMTVADTSPFTGSSGVVHIGTEAIIWTGQTSTTLTGLIRGAWGSIAQAHFTQGGTELSLPAVTSRPLSLEGRRAYLYAYGDGDDLQGSGTLVWRGVCITDAKLDSTLSVWQITIDPITALWRQDLGGDLNDPFSPRGIYYPYDAGLYLAYGEGTGAGADLGAAQATTAPIETDYIYGYFPSNQALVEEINSRLATMVAAYDSGSATAQQVKAVASGDDDWYFQVVPDASSAQFVFVGAFSPVDGVVGWPLLDGGFFPPDLSWPEDASGARTLTMIANSPYWYFGEPGKRTVPRSWLGPVPAVYSYPVDPLRDASTYPSGRVYVGTDYALSDISYVILDGAGYEEERTVRVAARSSSAGYLDLDVADVAPEPGTTLAEASELRRFDRDAPLNIRATRRVATGALFNFTAGLIADSPGLTNRAALPFVTSEDLDQTEWANAVALAIAGREVASVRQYYVSEPIELAEYMAHECRLIGVYPRLTADGKIGAAVLRTPTDTEVAAATITDADVLVDGEMPTWERGALGTINAVQIKSAWDPIEEEFRRTDTIRDVTAYSRNKQPRVLEIAPRSRVPLASTDYRRTVEQVRDLAAPVFGVFGRPYSIIDLEVSMALFGVQVGDSVRLDITLPVPNGRGGRGIEGTGILVGRRWDLDQGRGRFSVYLPEESVAGYAPELWVTSESNVSGNQWDLTVTSEIGSTYDTFADGDALSDHFASGDKVRVWRWDQTSAGTVTGTVDSVTDSTTGPATGTIRVTFDSTWTPSTTQWILSFREAGNAVARQLEYAYWADSDLLIDSSEPPKVYGI